MIVARYFSTIHRQNPPSARTGSPGRPLPRTFQVVPKHDDRIRATELVGSLGGVNRDYPLKFLTKSIAFV
jgi:hypothetical protein